MELKLSTEVVSIDAVTKDAQIPKWKRVLDATIIITLLPLWLPLILMIAAIIKIVSRGPVLFKQERIGFCGRPFTIFKFRTMTANAEAAPHQTYLKELMYSASPMTKLDVRGDARLIPLGALLRATGLDELPQLLNVLRGEMSLVGPRPCTRYEYEQYLPWHTQRLDALPGLTGLWQVNGKNRTTFEQMVRLDIYYTENQSFWMDLSIVLKTFPVLAAQLADAIARRLPPRTNSAEIPRVLEGVRDVNAVNRERLTKTQVLNRTCKETKCHR
jgi:lipopolysaccharide/colanic/teichoic acid biosynthesis glycosyltransferase